MNDLQVYRGDDKTWEVQFKNDAGTPIDITGWKVYFTVKEKDSDSDDLAKIKKDTEVHSDPTQGKSQIVLVPTDTENLKGNFYYDIQIKKATGEFITVIVGTLEVLRDVTRRKN